MKFAKRLFLIAGIYGIVGIPPGFFLEGMIGRMFPPAINHPEFFYGFIGIATAWQFLYFLLWRDPVRYRGLIWPSVFEKLSFGAAAIVLYAQGRISTVLMGLATIDIAFGLLYIVALRYVPEPDGRTAATYAPAAA